MRNYHYILLIRDCNCHESFRTKPNTYRSTYLVGENVSGSQCSRFDDEFCHNRSTFHAAGRKFQHIPHDDIADNIFEESRTQPSQRQCSICQHCDDEAPPTSTGKCWYHDCIRSIDDNLLTKLQFVGMHCDECSHPASSSLRTRQTVLVQSSMIVNILGDNPCAVINAGKY